MSLASTTTTLFQQRLVIANLRQLVSHCFNFFNEGRKGLVLQTCLLFQQAIQQDGGCLDNRHSVIRDTSKGIQKTTLNLDMVNKEPDPVRTLGTGHQKLRVFLCIVPTSSNLRPQKITSNVLPRELRMPILLVWPFRNASHRCQHEIAAIFIIVHRKLLKTVACHRRPLSLIRHRYTDHTGLSASDPERMFRLLLLLSYLFHHPKWEL